jgi:signal transduction histidine kinase/CheY-like chemotaxis protein
MAATSSTLLQAFVHAWPAAVLVFDRQRRVTYNNPAARALFGEDLERLTPAERAQRWTLRDPAGRLVAENVAPSTRALRGETRPAAEYQLVFGDGNHRRVFIGAYPLRDERGHVLAAACVLIDVADETHVASYRLFEGIPAWLETTERAHASAEMDPVIAETGRALAASLDYEKTLDTLVHAVVPRLADWCVIRLVEGDAVRRLRTAYASSDLVALAADMEDYHRARTTPDVAGTTSLNAVLRTGQPTLVARVSDDWLRSVAQDERHLSLLQRLHVGSLMHVPLLMRGRTIGVITLVRTTGGEPYEIRHLALVEELCDRAAVAIENARLFGEREQRRHEAQALSDIARLLAEAMDPVVVAQRIADSVRIFLEDTASAAVYSLESPRDEARAVAISTQGDVLFHWTRVLPPGAGAVALAVAQRQTITASDVLAHPDIAYPPAARARLEASEYRAVLAIPLIAHDRVLGALAIGARSGRRFDDREIALLSAFANQAAVSFHNARLYQESERRGREAESARAAAEAANRSKDDFLAVLSHELRSPLTAILGWTRMLQRGALSSAQAGAALEAIDRNTRLQARLINDLLDVSRIVAGKVDVERQPVDLAAVVRDVIASARQDAHARQLLAEPVIDAEAGRVIGDRMRLQQVVTNLVSNAVKYTPRGGRVEVRLLRANSHVEVSVSDTGEGIDSADLPLIFERFHQVDPSTTRRHGGLGLGLTIVRHFVELHGGSVHAISAGHGRGSTFIIRLPSAGAALAAVTAARRPATAGTPGEPVLRGIHALFIDDNEDARALVRTALESAGAHVDLAASAEEGLALFDAERFDIVLSDIGMPDMDGYDFVQRLRARPRGAAVPTIALTAYAGVDDERRALAAGFQRHVSKPIDPGELVGIVRSVIEPQAA